MSRLRGLSKAPVAVAGILALPLFFVALIAFSLRIDKPSHRLTATSKVILGDPTKGTLGTIYLLAFGLSVLVVIVGLLAMLLRSRLAPIVPAVVVIVAAVLLIVPLGRWAAGHTSRYPLGVDNIPSHSPQDLSLRGQWEQGAESTAHQIGLSTIGLAGIAIALSVLLEIRRRRGKPEILLQPTGVDAEMTSGGAPQITGGG